MIPKKHHYIYISVILIISVVTLALLSTNQANQSGKAINMAQECIGAEDFVNEMIEKGYFKEGSTPVKIEYSPGVVIEPINFSRAKLLNLNTGSHYVYECVCTQFESGHTSGQCGWTGAGLCREGSGCKKCQIQKIGIPSTPSSH